MIRLGSSKWHSCGTKSNIWNNDGDPGVLYDAQGQVVSRKWSNTLRGNDHHAHNQQNYRYKHSPL